jgi:hypothetical protein
VQEEPTKPGHLSKSGVLSHGLAAAGLLGCGLFASVLAPPAAASVIRDIAVKAGGKSSYSGPAQAVANSFLRGNSANKKASMQRTLHTTRRKRNNWRR